MALTAVALAMTAAEASAQMQGTSVANRPYRGIFGGGVGETQQSLTFNGSLGGGYDSDAFAAFRGETTPIEGLGLQRSGGIAGFGGGALSYSLSRERIDFGASANSNFYAYEDDDRVMTLRSYGGSANQNFRISPSTTVNASETVGYQPYRLQSLFPGIDASATGAPDVPLADTLIGSDAYLSWSGGFGVNHRLNQRLSMNGNYYAYSAEWSPGSRQTVHQGHAGISTSIGRGLGVHAGYGYGQGHYGQDESRRLVRNHSIDAGVDYNRTLSFSRRTSLSFSTGSVAVRDREQTHFRLTGHAQLLREIGRTWRAVAAYSRDVQFLEQLQEVVFSDAVNFSLAGLLNRRHSFHVSAGVSHGDVGFSGTDNNALAVYASVGLTTAVNRFVGLGTDYSFYRHSFGDDVVLPIGVLPNIDRHSVRAYVSLWAPLFSRARRPNAAR
jgi:hypothetical protein